MLFRVVGLARITHDRYGVGHPNEGSLSATDFRLLRRPLSWKLFERRISHVGNAVSSAHNQERNLSVYDLVTLLRGDLVHPTAATKHGPPVIEAIFTFEDPQPRSVFFAYRGSHIDGHSSIAEACAEGAAVVVVEDRAAIPENCYGIVVPYARRAVGTVAAELYGRPTGRIASIGITGTNGKTTTHWLVSHALRILGSRCLRIGTLGIDDGSEAYQSIQAMTTPPAPIIQAALAKAVSRAIPYCAFEVSSHGLALFRVSDVRFSIAVFTNLSEDHLDFHRDVEDYFQVKSSLFHGLQASDERSAGLAVINADDAHGRRLQAMCTEWGVPVFSFGKDATCDLRLKGVKHERAGLHLTFQYQDGSYVASPALFGTYNGYNFAAALSVLLALGYSATEAIAALEQSPGVPGRLEPVLAGDRRIFVDYAHTPDGLRNVLATLRALPHEKLWLVFGCGGDRDPGRRAGMGAVAAEYVDEIVISTDNPRSEDPEKIAQDILKSGCTARHIELDRAKAIQYAVEHMGEDDILLLAGKGHETYQLVGGEVFPFSDREQAELAFGAMNLQNVIGVT